MNVIDLAVRPRSKRAPTLAMRVAALYGLVPDRYVAAMTGENTEVRRRSLDEAAYIHQLRTIES